MRLHLCCSSTAGHIRVVRDYLRSHNTDMPLLLISTSYNVTDRAVLLQRKNTVISCRKSVVYQEKDIKYFGEKKGISQNSFLLILALSITSWSLSWVTMTARHTCHTFEPIRRVARTDAQQIRHTSDN